MKRTLYEPDHEAYRETVREFLSREVAPHQADWDREHWIDREVFARAAKAGIYALQIGEQYGGAGEPDYRYRMVVSEEIARINALSFGLTISLQDDLVLHYLLDLTNEEQRRRWLPGFATGEFIGALAMTEPGAGSDLKGIRTTARKDGEHWVLNGQKTFISSGIMSDVVVVAARTSPDGGSNGFSLFVVERDTPGFERGRQLEKIGLPGQDTSELFFNDADRASSQSPRRRGTWTSLFDESPSARAAGRLGQGNRNHQSDFRAHVPVLSGPRRVRKTPDRQSARPLRIGRNGHRD